MRALVCIAGLVVAVWALGAACASTERPLGPLTGPKPVLSTGLGQLRGVACAGAVWIAPLPGRSELDLAHRRGIATLIDLSLASEGAGFDLRQACHDAGLEYVDARPERDEAIDDALVDRVLLAIEHCGPRALLLVSVNASRAAMFFAIHRVRHDGVSLEQALVEARRCGMKAGGAEALVRQQIARLSVRGR